MDKVSFTPGPWYVDSWQGSHSIFFGVRGADNGDVVGSEGLWGRGDEVNCANARLIAAAPDLYTCLKGILDRHWEYLRDIEDLTDAYDALEKATGCRP